jgi:hypothetical protein
MDGNFFIIIIIIKVVFKKLRIELGIFFSCFLKILMECLEVWLWLFFKIFFTQKCIKIIFFIFLKIFLISAN